MKPALIKILRTKTGPSESREYAPPPANIHSLSDVNHYQMWEALAGSLSVNIWAD